MNDLISKTGWFGLRRDRKYAFCLLGKMQWQAVWRVFKAATVVIVVIRHYKHEK